MPARSISPIARASLWSILFRRFDPSIITPDYRFRRVDLDPFGEECVQIRMLDALCHGIITRDNSVIRVLQHQRIKDDTKMVYGKLHVLPLSLFILIPVTFVIT